MHKIIKKQDFHRVFSGQKRIHSAYFTIYWLRVDLEQPRIGIVISKKNVKLAVRRNRLRRLIKESFRQQLQQLPNVDLVVVVKKIADLATNQEVRACLNDSWLRLAKRSQLP